MNQHLFNLSKQFRNCLEKMNKYEFPNSPSFHNFPRGCCGDTSNLLAKYLLEHEIITQYCWGINTNNQSHAWLETADWIIDITADQFEHIEEDTVITKDRSWYKQFQNQKRKNSDFETFNTYNKDRLSTIYKNIKDRLTN